MIAVIAQRIALEFIPIVDELTTSDLQGCIDAAVSMAGLCGDEAREAENRALELIYESREPRDFDELGRSYLEYSCGCRHETTEKPQYFDHQCASCYINSTRGKRW